MTSQLGPLQAYAADVGISTRPVGDRSAAGHLGATAAKDFEGMFLRQTLESMLPHSESGVYGKGTAAGIWRSMLADQMSGVLAEAKVLGLSEILIAKNDVEA